MSLLLVEHKPNGRARYIVDTGRELPQLFRDVPIVSDHVTSIPCTRWCVAKVGCYSCGHVWAAYWPERCPSDALECLRCGEPTGTIVETHRCIECGWSGECVAPPGTPEVTQCGGCRLMSATAA